MKNVRRHSLDETRERILDAGIGLLEGQGYALDAGQVSLIDACREAGLGTAGSGYKIWSSQGAFRLDLLRYFFERVEAGLIVPSKVMSEVGRLDRYDDVGAIIRVGANVRAASTIGRAAFTKAIALWLSANFDDDLREQQLASQQRQLDELGKIYQGMLRHYGLEIKPPFSIDLFTVAVAAETIGLGYLCAFDDDPGARTVHRPTGPDGSDESWHLLGCVVEALVDAFTRPFTPD